jgi:hypothetical protein
MALQATKMGVDIQGFPTEGWVKVSAPAWSVVPHKHKSTTDSTYTVVYGKHAYTDVELTRIWDPADKSLSEAFKTFAAAKSEDLANVKLNGSIVVYNNESTELCRYNLTGITVYAHMIDVPGAENAGITHEVIKIKVESIQFG